MQKRPLFIIKYRLKMEKIFKDDTLYNVEGSACVLEGVVAADIVLSKGSEDVNLLEAANDIEVSRQIFVTLMGLLITPNLGESVRHALNKHRQLCEDMLTPYWYKRLEEAYRCVSSELN